MEFTHNSKNLKYIKAWPQSVIHAWAMNQNLVGVQEFDGQ